MADPDRPAGAKAVFLSYTTEDKAVALAVCEALRDAGVEVWMDQSELQGGDAWDDHIRRQLRECALIIPIISARTQARREGYFRLEWKLADERMHLVAEGTPLIVPVVADDTQQKDALVPKSFLAVQWSRLPHGHVPPAFVVRVRRLLELDSTALSPSQPSFTTVPASSSVAGLELLPPGRSGVAGTMDRVEPRPAGRLVPLVLGSCLAFVAGALAVWFLKPMPVAAPRPVTRWVYNIPEGQELRGIALRRLAVSPDGQSFVYNTPKGLYLRRIGELESRQLSSELSNSPTFSPDGLWIAYTVTTASAPVVNELKRVPHSGGAATLIARIEGSASQFKWGPDGQIYFTSIQGLQRVPATGGVPELLIKNEGDALGSPEMLPDGDSVLFHIAVGGVGSPDTQIAVQSLKSGTRTILVRAGADPHYLPTGHLMYMSGQTLFGVRFDPRVPAVAGSPAALLTGIQRANVLSTSLVQLGVSDEGTVVYLEGDDASEQRLLAWVDREGRETPLPIPALDGLGYPRLSPEGSRIAAVVRGDVWVYFLDGRPPIKLTSSGDTYSPLWTPDGKSLAYEFRNQGILQVAADGSDTTAPKRISPELHIHPHGWSADGKYLVAVRMSVPAFPNPDIVQWLVGDYSKVEPVVQTPANEGGLGAVLSPDGHWLAYVSNQTENNEIWIRPYPGPGVAQRVSPNGGVFPIWDKQGRELYYYEFSTTPSARRLMAVKVTLGETITFGPPQPLFGVANFAQFRNGQQPPVYDVAADGRFLMMKNANPDARSDDRRLIVIQNWFEEVKRALPVK